jgi:voltage-gated potassium channel
VTAAARPRQRYTGFMDSSKEDLRRERWKLTARLVRTLEGPMLLLSFVWTVLLIIEFTSGLSPRLQVINDAIWAAFVAQFAVEFLTAPEKGLYLRKRWVTALSLALPAFRLLRLVRAARVVRLARAARSVRLARLLGAINRGMRALSIGLGHRGLGYLILLTLLVAITGAAGMYRFELDAPGGPGFADYGTAVWWTAMLLTTMGSDYWPRTTEGRVLCLLLAIYAFAVFGYVTAAIAAYFVGKDQKARRA